MGKKQFEIRFDGTLQCHVKPAARAKAMKQRITDGEQSVDLEVPTAGGMNFMFSAYSDQLPKGLMTFKWTGDRLTVVLKGCWPMKDCGFDADAEFVAAADAKAPVLAGMSDADFESLEFDGGTQVAVGTLCRVEAVAKPSASGKVPPKVPKQKAGVSSRGSGSPSPWHEGIELVLATDAKLPLLLSRLSGDGEREIDYEVEARLEALEKALQDAGVEVRAALEALGSDMADFGSRLEKRWLLGEVSGCGVEAKVRASEVLAAWSVASDEPRKVTEARLKATRWERRAWAACTVRLARWKDAAKVLAPLKKDPFEDDNGIHLVREAAGFGDD